MRTLSISLQTVAVMVTLGLPATAQTTQADIAARLIGKPLILKGAWSDDHLKFDGDGHPLKSYHNDSFTVGGFDADSVKVSGKAMQVSGTRMALTWDSGGAGPKRVPMYDHGPNNPPEKLTIEIDCHAACDYGPALTAIFADNLPDMVALLPQYWQRYAETHFLPPDSNKPMRNDVGIKGAMHVGGGVKPPRIIRSFDPEFSEAARRQKFSGNVMVYCWVEKDGTPSHLQIARPAGLGLDEKAIEAVSRYKFQPALRDGEPVLVDLYIEVNFQIF